MRLVIDVTFTIAPRAGVDHVGCDEAAREQRAVGPGVDAAAPRVHARRRPCRRRGRRARAGTRRSRARRCDRTRRAACSTSDRTWSRSDTSVGTASTRAPRARTSSAMRSSVVGGAGREHEVGAVLRAPAGRAWRRDRDRRRRSSRPCRRRTSRLLLRTTPERLRRCRVPSTRLWRSWCRCCR